MIHFATVHYQNDLWIDVQLRYLGRYVHAPFQVHACFTALDPEPHRSKFTSVLSSTLGSHPAKLAQLADHIVATAKSSDVLVFIDSDAFPITGIDSLLVELGEFPLIAVRRDENLGDRQPHPCFCMTTVGFWREMGGDWGADHAWRNNDGRLVWDTGGNLLKILEDRQVQWKPLLRTNEINLHPLLFGIYGDTIYHHAAGSRLTITRVDSDRIRRENPGAEPADIRAKIDETTRANSRLSEAVLADIIEDRDFLSRFRL